jgi:hypothetical protein
MEKLLVYFALVFVIVAGTAAVLTVVAPLPGTNRSRAPIRRECGLTVAS